MKRYSKIEALAEGLKVNSRCYACGCVLDDDEPPVVLETYSDLRTMCEYCADEAYICDDCGAIIPYNDGFYDEDNNLNICPNCLDDNYRACDECSEYHRIEDMECDDNHDLCCRCFSRYYVRCEDCGDIVYETDAYYDEYSGMNLCDSCYSEAQGLICGYHSNKSEYEFRKFGVADWHFGLEIETDNVGRHWRNGQASYEIDSILGDRVCFERDCSISGFECVTFPHSIGEWYENEDIFREALDRLDDMGFEAATGNCGMHLHVSRSILGNTPAVRSKVLYKLIKFYTLNYDRLLELSERSDGAAYRWASPNPLTNLVHYVQQRTAGGHAVAVNMEHADTIEFRLRRGTLDWQKMTDWIELHIKLVEKAKTVPNGCYDWEAWMA